MKPVYERFIENPDFTKSEFVELIKCAEDPEAVRRLKEEAVRIREIYYGKKVFTRGLIEYTNYCKNDCYYCGIRKSNTNAKRYRLTEDEIMACCENGYELGFRTFVLQGGEDAYYTDDRMVENYNIEYALERILEKKENEMESIQPEKKAGYDLQEELILDDWIAEQEMKGQVVKDRQSVWGFLNQRLQKRRKKRESQWDEIMADDSEE